MTAAPFLQLSTQIVFLLIFVLTLATTVRRPDRANLEIAALFGSLAAISLPGLAQATGWAVQGVSLVAALLLLAQPYLLLQVVAHFRRLPSIQRPVGLIYLVGAWGIVLSTRSSPLPLPLVLVLVAGFAYVEGYASLALLQSAIAGRGVARRRLAAAAAGSGFLTLAALGTGVVAVVSGSADSVPPGLSGLGLLSALSYYAAFAPPRWLRRSLQMEEVYRFMESLAEGSSAQRLAAIDQAGPAIASVLAAKVAVVAVGNPPAQFLMLHPDPLSAPTLEAAGLRSLEVGETSPVLNAAWTSRKPVASANPGAWGEALQRLAPAFGGARAVVAAPLMAYGNLYGLLIVLSERGAFLEDDIDLIGLLAGRVALAIEDGRLYAEAARQAAESRAILEAAPDAILIANESGRILAVNSRAEQLFGYARDDLLGSVIEELVPESAREVHVSHRGRYLADPRTRPMGAGLDLRARRKDGELVPVEISLSPLPSQDGNLVIAVIRDDTDRREREEELAQRTAQLEQSNAQLEQFAYVASHDLQEPLRMVVSFLDLLKHRYDGQLDADAHEFIRFAVDGGTRMQRLVQDLLAYSRAGSLQIQRERIDCNGLIDEVLLGLGPAMQESGGTVRRSDLPIVWGDRVQLSRVFQNLIGNGLKFHGADPAEVRIEVEAAPEGWIFSVHDNGIGFEPEHSERIFGLFQRLHGHEEFSGSGIGLTVSRRIVERHGGRMWVRSVPGKGSTFSFTLPAVEG